MTTATIGQKIENELYSIGTECKQLNSILAKYLGTCSNSVSRLWAKWGTCYNAIRFSNTVLEHSLYKQVKDTQSQFLPLVPFYSKKKKYIIVDKLITLRKVTVTLFYQDNKSITSWNKYDLTEIETKLKLKYNIILLLDSNYKLVMRSILQ